MNYNISQDKVQNGILVLFFFFFLLERGRGNPS